MVQLTIRLTVKTGPSRAHPAGAPQHDAGGPAERQLHERAHRGGRERRGHVLVRRGVAGRRGTRVPDEVGALLPAPLARRDRRAAAAAGIPSGRDGARPGVHRRGPWSSGGGVPGRRPRSGRRQPGQRGARCDEPHDHPSRAVCFVLRGPRGDVRGRTWLSRGRPRRTPGRKRRPRSSSPNSGRGRTSSTSGRTSSCGR